MIERPPQFNASRLPREVAPGLFWLGECLVLPYKDLVLHSSTSVYLLKGEDAALLVDCAFPSDRPSLYAQLDSILADGPELRYLFLSHQEVPHAGAVGHLLDRYPNAIAIGDIRDYHLYFPDLAERFEQRRPGDVIDLGGTSFELVEPVVEDLLTTSWGIGTPQNALFSVDGVSFGHMHEAGHCGMTASELPELDITQMGSYVIHFALPWMGRVDTAPYVTALERLIREREIEVVLSTHGLPITDLAETMPKIYEGMRHAHEFIA